MPGGKSSYVHLVAGGVGGTVGATVTCPLEVVKTRLQSSVPTFRPIFCPTTTASGVWSIPVEISMERPAGIFSCLRHIVQTEGLTALFKGLGPTLVGVAPSRATYFSVYAKAKKVLNQSGLTEKDSKLVHVGSACIAGFVTSTLTSPLWVVKTRLQLDNRNVTKGQIMKLLNGIWKTDGLKGFYRGLTASYFGITETMIHFVLYEHLKGEVQRHHLKMRGTNETNVMDFIQYMMAAATSKCLAAVFAYPHEVIRTRLRQKEVDGKRKYHSFFQAFRKIFREEGRIGLYGGLGTHLLRQVPNTAIMFLTYEAVVHSFGSEDLS
ncbi:Mitochondrial carrier protein Rim2 [Acropora cervicornis]|uniref:Mitochondrial carrier protein Rim2 n=1 Tax=Acropora cervicornis TaxID=6130 RepID=A0AAD9Q7H2_ACRCE|nr:Mitochondrial carrier protein Rim2 [Acropora cervicornis]